MIEAAKRKSVKDLLDKRKARKETGLFVVDGPRMVREIPGEHLTDVFVTESFLKDDASRMCENILKDGNYSVVTESEMEKLSGTVTPQGILAVARQKKTENLEDIAARCSNTPFYIALEDIQDPGNLGTIFRAGEACGVSAVIMSGRTCDVYSPKVVRSTMGSVFRVPFLYSDDMTGTVRALREGAFGRKADILAAELRASVDYTLYDYRNPFCIMIGNEARGLSEELIGEATVRIKIPMLGNVESLNAAVAAAVIGFEAARQRRI